MEETAPQLTRFEISLGFFLVGLMYIGGAWFHARAVGPFARRFSRDALDVTEYEISHALEESRRRKPKDAAEAYRWRMWWGHRIPGFRRDIALIVVPMFLASAGFFIAALVMDT